VAGLAVLPALLPGSAACTHRGPPGSTAPRALAPDHDLDGDRVLLGPVGGVVHRDGGWDSAGGAHAAWVRLRERRPVAATGVSLGAWRLASEDTGRVWLEALVGTRRLPGGALTGLSAGPIVELAPTEHARLGATGALWLYAGVVPFVRAGWLAEAGASIELGLSLPLPVWRAR
jgi:hypothetical protein